MEKQPAYKSYVFDQGYRDVGSAFAKTWRTTFAPVKKEVERLGDMFLDGKILGGIISIFADLLVFGAITIFNIALNSVISLFLILLFLLTVPVVYVSFLLVWCMDLIYRGVKRISSKCMFCQYKFDLPVYLCPHCGRKHTKLIPSSYGIFKRTCICGHKIPTTFFNGRHKLKALCPECGFVVADGGKHVDVCIPVVGGRSSGKTCYIHMALSRLAESAAAKNGLEFAYAPNAINDYRTAIQRMRENRELPDKTSDERLQYYQFYMTPKGEKIKRLMSLCDVAGEAYLNNGSVANQIGFRYADAFIVVVDPLSVQGYREEVEKRFRTGSYGASQDSMDAILSKLVSVLENMHSISSKTMLKTDVAVVFTKCDIPGLDEIIGKKAVATCMRNKKLSQEEASNLVCEEFLRKYGESNFANNLKAKFKSVQYFTCSSLGYNRNESGYTPDGVEDPILWIYRKVLH